MSVPVIIYNNNRQNTAGPEPFGRFPKNFPEGKVLDQPVVVPGKQSFWEKQMKDENR